MEKKNYDFLFRFLFVGEEKVGKSEIINRYINGKFNENYFSTIGNKELFIYHYSLNKYLNFLLKNRCWISHKKIVV